MAALSPRVLIQAAFFLQAMSFAGWFARVGDVQLQIGLTADQLGIALMGAMGGAVLTFPLGPAAVEKFGTRRLALIAIPLTALACALGAVAWDTASLFVCTLLTGIGHGFATMANNVEADRIEEMTGRRVMNTCHGTWGVGFVVGTLIGTAARTWEVSPILHLGLVVPVLTVLTLIFILPMKEAPHRPHSGPIVRTFFPRPTKAIMGLVAFIIASVIVENGAMTWSVIYFRDAFDVPSYIESLSLPLYMLSLSAGRLLTDNWVERWGPTRVASVLSIIALVGLAPVAWAGSLPLAILGFVLIGFGMSCAFPLSISAAARIGDRPSADNVAAFSMIQRTMAMGVPAFVGFIAAGWGIAAAFAAMLPLPLLAIVFARYLEPRSVVATA
jgi:MFS family permease